MDTDRNLLFAVLALQADLIDRERFVRACTLWAAHKERPIADLLIEQGWLSHAGRGVVDLLLGFKLRKHGGDVQASLAEAAGPSCPRDRRRHRGRALARRPARHCRPTRRRRGRLDRGTR
jgi:hypothetical protein